MSMVKNIKYLIIRKNKESFKKWVTSLEERINNCSSNNMLFILKSITDSKIELMNKEQILQINKVLCFHSTFDNIIIRNIFFKYIDQVGLIRARITLKIISEHITDEKDVFITDIIEFYQDNYTFVEPERLTFC